MKALKLPDGIISGKHVCEWVCAKTGTRYLDGVGLGLVKNGKIIAAAMYDHYLNNSIQIHIVIEGKLTREAIFVAFDYPFRQLKVKKLIGVIDSTNAPSLKYTEHIGFIKEAEIKDAGFHGNLWIYTMTPDQCKYLGENYGRLAKSTTTA